MFDLCVIGSSPLLLLEAVVASSAGQAVVIVEKQPTLGGAWQPVKALGSHFDNGAHLLYLNGKNLNRVFDWLEEVTETPFVPLAPAPSGDRSLGWWKVPELSFRVDPLTSTAALRLLGRAALHHAELILGLIGAKSAPSYRFPHRGIADWINAIEGILVRNKVTLMKEARCTGFRSAGEMTGVVIQRGDAPEDYLEARRVVSTSRCDFELERAPFVQTSLEHVFLRLSDTGPARLSFHKFAQHPMFFCAADITHSERPEPSVVGSTRVLALALNKWISRSSVDPGSVVRDLIARRLLAAGSRVVDSEFVSYSSLQRSRVDVDLQNRQTSKLELLYCDNLMAELAAHLPRWSGVLQSVPSRPHTRRTDVPMP